MRIPLLIGLGAAALALAAGAADSRPAAKPRPAEAASAEHAGRPASYRTVAGHGYSARDRRMLDCLASDRRYDPRADRIEVRRGLSERCSR
jgi:hypothetical protein